MAAIYSGIGCNLDKNLLQSIFPLLQNEKIEAIEWSFDTLYKQKNIPDWFIELLRIFGNAGRLVGHGVYGSLFAGVWSPAQADWLQHLSKMVKNFQFDHISEHFGFMTGEDFHKGAPLNLPMNKTVLNLGIDRLKRVQNIANCPVGIENLAVAYHWDSVRRQGEFLGELVAAVDGFIILDLHNLYCQLHNFELDFEQVINAYPLERVREIHISGGSWEQSQVEKDKIIRRDTHDAGAPESVFELLQKAIKLCPNLKFVMFEQLGVGLQTAAAQQVFQSDFTKMQQIVSQQQNEKDIISFLPNLPHLVDNQVLESKELAQQQQVLSSILEQSTDYEQVVGALHNSELQHSDWQIEQWQPAMIETAWAIAQKWKNGFN